MWSCGRTKGEIDRWRRVARCAYNCSRWPAEDSDRARAVCCALWMSGGSTWTGGRRWVPACGYRAEAALRVAGWRRLGVLSLVRGSSWRDAAEHDLDLIELTDSWAHDAIAAAQENRIAGMPTLPLRYLVLMKLVAARTTDLGDVSRMLGRASREQVAEARGVFTRFGHDDDLIDFEQLVRLGRLERELESPDMKSDPLS